MIYEEAHAQEQGSRLHQEKYSGTGISQYTSWPSARRFGQESAYQMVSPASFLHSLRLLFISGLHSNASDSPRSMHGEETTELSHNRAFLIISSPNVSPPVRRHCSLSRLDAVASGLTPEPATRSIPSSSCAGEETDRVHPGG